MRVTMAMGPSIIFVAMLCWEINVISAMTTVQMQNLSSEGEPKLERPRIIVKEGRRDENGNPGYVEMDILENSTLSDGTITVRTRSQSRFFIDCDAPYIVRWRTSPPVAHKFSAVTEVRRTVEDVFDPSTFHFYSQGIIDTELGLSGFVDCQSFLNESLSSRLQFFVTDSQGQEQGPKLVGSGRRFEINLVQKSEESWVVPCMANSFNLQNVKLLKIQDEGEVSEIKEVVTAVYNPKVGFTADRPLSFGTYQCAIPSTEDPDTVLEQVTFDLLETFQNDQTGSDQQFWKEVPNKKMENLTSSTGDGGGLELEWTAWFGQVDCNSVNTSQIIQPDFQSVQCTSPFECDVFRGCFSHDCGSKVVKGIPCQYRSCSYLNSQSSGVLLCTSGDNKLEEYYYQGLDRRQYTMSQTPPRRALIQMDDVEHLLYTNKEHYFFCEASHYFFTQELQFVAQLKNGTAAEFLPGSYRLVNNDQTGRESRGAINRGIWLKVTKDMVGVTCLAPWYNSGSQWMDFTRNFEVRDVSEAKIKSMSNDAHVFYIGEETRNLICSADGEPKPAITWSVNKTEIVNGADFQIKATDEGDSILQFPKIEAHLAGIYTCKASNDLGHDKAAFQVDVQEQGLVTAAIWGIIAGCIVGLILVGVAFMFMWRKYTITKGKLRMLTMSEIYEFKNGNREALQNNVEIGGDNIHYLPFNSTYEVPKADLTICKDKILGSGEFGIVYEGNLKGTCVAVKTTKPKTDIEYFKAFLKEVKVMTYIGSHPHVVELLGTVTNDIQKRIVFIVIELSPFGSLENYLKENRMGYVKFAMSNTNEAPKSNAYTNMPSNTDFGLPYANITAKITTLDFIKWAYEIADGMSHLARKKIIHGDLATRNILLFEGLTAKITDFGLSRQMYEQTNYIKKNQAPLPWRSMALEALKYLQFSTASDVWSYAVTIWEIFSLGTVPFAGLTWSEDFVRKIEDGLRVGKPAACSDAIYQNMLRCWHPEPSERPSFNEITMFYHQLFINEKLNT